MKNLTRQPAPIRCADLLCCGERELFVSLHDDVLEILLIEDNPGDIELIGEAIARHRTQARIAVARDGVKATHYLQARGRRLPDLVLLDLKLPRKSGLEVLTEMKRDIALRRIPVIVMTSSANDSDIQQAYDRQATAYFAKPLDSYETVIGQIFDFVDAIQLPRPPAPEGLQSLPALPDDRRALPPTPHERHLASIVEHCTEAIISVDLEGRIVSWNAAAERLYGYTHAEAEGKSIRLVVPEERLSEVYRELDAVKAEALVEPFESVRVTRDGRQIATSLSSSPIRDMAGNVVGMSVIVRDVTERQQAEEKFRLAVESAPSAMIMVDDEGKIVLANAETERMFGYSRHDLIGRSIELLVPPRLRESHPRHRDAFRTKPEARAMGAGRDLYGLRKDGSELPVEIGLNPIETREGVFVLAAVVDIAERKLAEERFHLAVESSPSAMVMVDASGQILLVNAETLRLFGYERAELIGVPIEILVPGRFRGQHPHHRASFLAKPQARPMGAGRELYGVRKDGTEFPVEIGLNPIETRDGVFVLSAIVDITERKAAEQALAERTRELERSNAELQQFAYVVSHDLKEPLRMVASFTDLLSRRYGDVLDETGLKYIEYAVSGARRMQHLMDALLEYSRIGSRKRRLSFVDAKLAFEAAVANLAASITQSNARIDVGPLPEVLADQAQLTAVFQNLLANAIKFCRTGPPTIRVHAARRGERWIFSVTDNGIGVDPRFADRIFEVFQRLHTETEYPGTGIGLPICKRIIERFGGQIWLEPTEEPGATFQFALPVAEAP